MRTNFLSDKYSNLDSVAEQHKSAYIGNAPFPNIAFPDFFNAEILKGVLSEFPDIEKTEKDIFYNNPNEQKYATKGEYRFGPKTKEFVHFLNSQPFLEFLQELTGIKETLIPDPYFEGGGFHQIKPGGFLKLHVDFHQHRKMKLDRRLNILVYLNENWQESYGGHFELWEKDMSKRVVRIAPLFNTLAMFFHYRRLMAWTSRSFDMPDRPKSQIIGTLLLHQWSHRFGQYDPAANHNNICGARGRG
jgi:hypothetical protein